MKFKPKSEQEIQEANLFPKGEYDFEVVTAEDAVSKRTGKEMIKMKLRVFNDQGRTQFVDDYLLPSLEFKLRHFCEAVGLLEQYDEGSLCAEDCDGRTGRLKLKVDPAGDFPAKNSVQDYVIPNAEKSSRPSRPARPPVDPDLDMEDDEIPF